MEFTESIELTKALMLVFLLIFCSATDLTTRRIPNAVLLPVLMSALFLNSLGSGLSGLADSLGGLVLGLLMLMPLHIFGRMGAGDIKLLGVVGSILGAGGAVAAGLATMIAGAILGVIYLAWVFIKPGVVSRIAKLRQLGSRSPAITYQTLTDGARTAEIPYALAIAAGTAAAVMYLDLLIEVNIV